MLYNNSYKFLFLTILSIFLPLFLIAQSPIDHLEITQKRNRILFQYLYKKTLQREAFSPIKQKRENIYIKKDMKGLKKEFLKAKNAAELYYVLAKFSNLRKDAHLLVLPIKNGISRSYLQEKGNFKYPMLYLDAQLETDFKTNKDYFLFISDLAKSNDPKQLAIGDRIIKINGQSAEVYYEKIKAYLNFSTHRGFWASLPKLLGVKTPLIPPTFYKDSLHLVLEKKSGYQYKAVIPYKKQAIKKDKKQAYPNFEVAKEFSTFNLYQSTKELPVLIIELKNLQKTLSADIQSLMAFAIKNQLLNYAIILDATNSKGGKNSVQLLRHLSPKKFKPTFGNLRISDITTDFITKTTEQHHQNQEKKTLINWLNKEVQADIQNNRAYTRNVPFKMEHQKDSILPAPIHFKGSLVAFFSPQSGSQIDQMAAMVVDNNLGHTLGMPCGGYSNTWEWTEILTYPATNIPLVKYSWSIGQTIRPNGAILEGNPASIMEYLPKTQDNHLQYKHILLEKALQWLGG